MSPLFAYHQDFDFTKLIFALVFLFVGFVNWIIKVGKQSLEKNKSATPPPLSEEEKRARYEAIARNLGLRPAPSAIAPPPLPGPAPAPKRDQQSHVGTIKSTRREGIAPGLRSVSEAAAPVANAAHPLLALLKTASATRQAVLMKEILGPPKALQNSSDALW